MKEEFVMSEGNSLINFGDVSKPVTVLLEKISDVIGGSLKPYQMKRIAKAEIEVAKMKAQGALELSDIQQRGLERLVHEEGKKQENIESITIQAINNVNNDASPELVQNDWLSFFYDKCRIVSDKDMQVLWSSVLAGEANKPGTFSKKTIELIATLEKEEAHLFTKLCGYSIYYDQEFIPLILKVTDDFYCNNNIAFTQLSHLDSIGLIKYDAVQGFAALTTNNILKAKYFNDDLLFEFQQEPDDGLDVGCVILTKSGQELASICGATKNKEFLNYISNYYKTNENIDMKVL